MMEKKEFYESPNCMLSNDDNDSENDDDLDEETSPSPLLIYC